MGYPPPTGVTRPFHGARETQAKAQGIEYRLVKIPMVAVLRMRTLSETRGFMKALNIDSDRILGFTAFGVEAGEVIASVQVAICRTTLYGAARCRSNASHHAGGPYPAIFSGAPDF